MWFLKIGRNSGNIQKYLLSILKYKNKTHTTAYKMQNILTNVKASKLQCMSRHLPNLGLKYKNLIIVRSDIRILDIDIHTHAKFYNN